MSPRSIAARARRKALCAKTRFASAPWASAFASSSLFVSRVVPYVRKPTDDEVTTRFTRLRS
jgi:hypothetical protein